MQGYTSPQRPQTEPRRFRRLRFATGEAKGCCVRTTGLPAAEAPGTAPPGEKRQPEVACRSIDEFTATVRYRCSPRYPRHSSEPTHTHLPQLPVTQHHGAIAPFRAVHKSRAGAGSAGDLSAVADHPRVLQALLHAMIDARIREQRSASADSDAAAAAAEAAGKGANLRCLSLVYAEVLHAFRCAARSAMGGSATGAGAELPLPSSSPTEACWMRDCAEARDTARPLAADEAAMPSSNQQHSVRFERPHDGFDAFHSPCDRVEASNRLAERHTAALRDENRLLAAQLNDLRAAHDSLKLELARSFDTNRELQQKLTDLTKRKQAAIV